MDKLDHKVFDPIYEECKDGSCDEDGVPDFQFKVFQEANELWDKYDDVYADLALINHNLLRDYRTGVIRDAGSMVSDWDVIREFENRHEWYKLDPAVFDELAEDESPKFLSFLAANNLKLWRALPAGLDIRMAVALYKAGILRQGGKMPEVCDKCGRKL